MTSLTIPLPMAQSAELKYCFHIKLPDNSNLYLTEFDKSILIDDKIFIPNSGMTLQEGEFNDSGQNYIILGGIFENHGIEKHHDLTDAVVKIYQCFAQRINYFVSYRCSTLNCAPMFRPKKL